MKMKSIVPEVQTLPCLFEVAEADIWLLAMSLERPCSFVPSQNPISLLAQQVALKNEQRETACLQLGWRQCMVKSRIEYHRGCQVASHEDGSPFGSNTQLWTGNPVHQLIRHYGKTDSFSCSNNGNGPPLNGPNTTKFFWDLRLPDGFYRLEEFPMTGLSAL